MKMHVRLVSLLMALTLCVGLATPAFAAEKSLNPDCYTLECSYTKVKKSYDLYRSGYFDEHDGAEVHTLDYYYALAGGASFTLTNVRQDAGYVFAWYCPYTMRTEPVEMWINGSMRSVTGEYVSGDGEVEYNYFLNRDGGWTFGTREGVNSVIGMARNEPAYYSGELSGALLYAGESMTFTLPDDGTDTVYLLYICYSNPETGYYRWQWSEFKYDEAGMAPVCGFSDVHAGDYYAQAVEWAVGQNVTTGYTADTFAPERPVTRAQAVTFLWRAAGCPEPSSTVSPFTDVTDPGAYYYKAVLWAAEQGITTGATSTTFNRNGTLSYNHILAFLCRAAGGDANGSGWAAKAAGWAAENGLTDGLTFSGGDDCPRADVVYCLWKQLG